MSIHPDFVSELRKHFAGDILLDLASRILYSTDASIYQVEPLGVAIPRTQDDLQAAMELAAKHKVPVLARGAGTSLAGQAIGEALILDCSRWLDHILDINPESQTATVEPGVILASLNREASRHGLQFGPDPASAERATIGGIIANNATGAHSILYGMTVDHLRAAEVVFADGSVDSLGEVDGGDSASGETHGAPALGPPLKAGSASRYSAFLAAARAIRTRDAETIRAMYPRSWRNSAGYRLNYLLPWSGSAPPEWNGGGYPAASQPATFNLAQMLAGSEGTLALIRRATLNLVRKPGNTALGILAFASVEEACDAVPALLLRHPSAIELVPRMLLRLAAAAHPGSRVLEWFADDPAAVLVVEFSADDAVGPLKEARALRGDVSVAETDEDQAAVWNLRKLGLGILDSRPTSARTQAFVEDCAVPVEHLGQFVREMQRILAEHGRDAGFYGHASAGCLHIRPILDLKTRQGLRDLREISEQTLALALRLGGSMVSEHGDGIARGEWLQRTYGEGIANAMRELKVAVDPEGLLSPRKMLEAPPMDTHLRYGPDYKGRAWIPGINFTNQGSLEIAIEQCNGQGVCRKDAGTMCPSFQATREEKHSTRGRANLLRALISSGSQPLRLGREASDRISLGSSVYEALDLCLGCKACRAECPSGVDMAKLKSAFLEEYFRSRSRPVRDYVFGYFHVTAKVLASLAPLVNTLTRVPGIRRTAARALKLTPERPFPQFASPAARPLQGTGKVPVLLVGDPFTHYVEPVVERAARDLLSLAGFEVRTVTLTGAGAALVSKGFLEAARRHAARFVRGLNRLDPSGSLPLLAIEPSELSTLKHDYCDLLPNAPDVLVKRLRGARSVEQILVDSPWFRTLRATEEGARLGFHPHCHEASDSVGIGGGQTATYAGEQLLIGCGYQMEPLAVGCCGMAGTFGYEAEHYELSQRIAERRLLPSIRKLGVAQIAATGAACRMQITQSGAALAQHPLVFAARALLPH